MSGSQTLSRGIQILEILAEEDRLLTIDQVAEKMNLHRSVCYRLIRTLEDHGLIVRTQPGFLQLGARLVTLGAGVERDIRAQAMPLLSAAVEALGLTCFLAIEDEGECLTLLSVEPSKVAVLSQRPGTRHSLTVGAPGLAILSVLESEKMPDSLSDEIVQSIEAVRKRGWAYTYNEVISGMHSVAVPLRLPDGRVAAVAALHVSEHLESSRIALRLKEVARALG